MSTIETCPSQVRAEQLSALYDAGADGDAALREHITSCEACQRRLNDYRRMTAALQAQVIPSPDARLRQGILAARERSASVVGRPRRLHDFWRAVAVAAAVLVVVGGFAGALLRQAALTRITSAPTATTISSAPPGWRQILPTRTFSLGGSQGFAVSRARPGRLVGCGVPGQGTDAWPYPALAISDDGGQTWRESAIQTLGSLHECVVVVDQLHPDTIIVGDAEPTQLAVTTDAGQTWRLLALPAGMTMNLAQFPNGNSAPALVNGHLIGLFHPASGAGRWAVGDLTFDGSFKALAIPLPYPESGGLPQQPLAFAVDPANAAHIYVMQSGRFDTSNPNYQAALYVTTDDGATWQAPHIFPYGERLNLWSPTPDALYLLIASPEMSKTGNPLQMSVDGGATWRAVTPAAYPVDAAWFGPDGRVMLLGGSPASLAELHPATGAVTSLGALPPASTSGFQGVVSDGAHPVILIASPFGVFVRPLP